MSQHPSHDLIGITDVAAKLPQFISKFPTYLSGLKTSIFTYPKHPAGLGLLLKNSEAQPSRYGLVFEDQKFSYQASTNGQTKSGIIFIHRGKRVMSSQ